MLTESDTDGNWPRKSNWPRRSERRLLLLLILLFLLLLLLFLRLLFLLVVLLLLWNSSEAQVWSVRWVKGESPLKGEESGWLSIRQNKNKSFPRLFIKLIKLYVTKVLELLINNMHINTRSVHYTNIHTHTHTDDVSSEHKHDLSLWSITWLVYFTDYSALCLPVVCLPGERRSRRRC